MHSEFIQYLFLILVILALVMLSGKLKIAYPIVLVVGGLLLSFTSLFPNVTIDPEAVFFIFLPPLLYEAAWQISWKEFWKWRRVITSFAFPIVVLTSCVVAFFSQLLIPGFTWALGFLLGGIISPPDAISATTIMRKQNLPKAMVGIIEGESLLNDATSLIIFRFALAAVVTGQFHLVEATTSFLLVVFMGIIIGVAVGLIFYGIHRLLPMTVSIEIILTLVTPYCMYYAAEYFHFSGVLSVVTGGLFLSSKRQSLLNYRSRIEGVNVWTNIVFVLNGLIFLLIGLQLPSIVQQLGDVSLLTATWYGLVISFVLIVCRICCTLGASLFTRMMSNIITVAMANPGWRAPLITGWAGMRGVVSLAAALSIPLLVDGSPFPHRNLILYITFVVILATLVLQGLTLPWVIRKLNVQDTFSKISEQDQEHIIRKKISKTSLNYLLEKYGNERGRNKYLDILLARLQLDHEFSERELNDLKGLGLIEYQNIHLEVLDQQRKILVEMNRNPDFDEELIRKFMIQIDLEELQLRENKLE